MRITKKFQLASLPLRFLPSIPALRLDFPGFSRVKIIAFCLLTLPLLMPELAIGQPSQQDIETSFRAGQAALRQGDFQLAIKEFKKVLAMDPGLVEAEANLGLAYQSVLDFDLAARYLAQALHERTNLPGLNVILGMDYLKLGSPEKALPYLQHALEL